VFAVDLYLFSNTLTGKIPSEIGLLPDSLGEFGIEKIRMTLYSARLSNCIVTFHLVIKNLMHSCCFVNYSSVELVLDSNALEGTVPSEVGQLKQLSEYTRD
jgi:hypothetical protein